MSPEECKRIVASFVEVCQNQHDLAFADEIFHPGFVNHYAPEGRPIQETAGRPAAGFQQFYGALLRGFPDATMTIDEQLAERDLVATRKTFRGTHTGELWGLPPSGNRVEWDFIDIMRVRDGKIIEHWTSMDLAGLREQMRPANGRVRQLRLVVEAEEFAEAVTFFRDVLGLPEEAAFSGDGDARVVILDAGRATLEIANPAQKRMIDDVEVGRQVAPRLRVAFEVDDAVARTADAVAGGAAEVAPPTRTPWDSLNARLDAPAGLHITLFQELGP